jgi:hypothetical protein
MRLETLMNVFLLLPLQSGMILEILLRMNVNNTYSKWEATIDIWVEFNKFLYKSGILLEILIMNVL